MATKYFYTETEWMNKGEEKREKMQQITRQLNKLKLFCRSEWAIALTNVIHEATT